MKLDELMGLVITELYSGMTGGSAQLPMPADTAINWVFPGMTFDESAFDFAIAGPYAGPTPLTLDYFKAIADAILAADPKKERKDVYDEARRMYQQNLLGTFENWSRLVNFIPLLTPQGDAPTWSTEHRDKAKAPYTQIVYAQSGRNLSDIWADLINDCDLADDDLTDQQKATIERLRSLLQEKVEMEDFITGEKRTEVRPSRVMVAYTDYRTKYENAVIDYAARLARSQSGSAEDVIEWNRSGAIYRQRALQAMSDWIGQGYKNDVERAQAVIDNLTGTSMVQWWERLEANVREVETTISGEYGYPFYPATIVPGAFARSPGWSHYQQMNLVQQFHTEGTMRVGTASIGIPLGIVNIGGAGGGGTVKFETECKSNSFGMEFEYTQVQIVYPYLNLNFLYSRGWKPGHGFVQNHGELLSDGKNDPKGAMIGVPTKALFVRKLKIHSQEVVDHVKSNTSHISAGGTIAIGPVVLGGGYAQATHTTDSSFSIDGASISIPAPTLVAFVSTLLPLSPNPDPNIKKWTKSGDVPK
jgi:hypothetical protein